MKVNPYIVATAAMMPLCGWAGPCATLFGHHNCIEWSSTSETYMHECSCGKCPAGTIPRGTSKETNKYAQYNGIQYTLHSGCAVECSCANNPDTSKRGGSCIAKSNDMSVPDYSTCSATPAGAQLCNTTTNKCNGTSITIAGQIYCEMSGQTCNLPFAATSMLASPYCSNGAAAPQGGVSCMVAACKSNSVPNPTHSACICNAGYYMDHDVYECKPCPSPMPPATTGAPGAERIAECYIPARTPIKDTSGTYEYTSNCSYTE